MSVQARGVRLADIPSCFEGIIPAAIATVADDGTPNCTYISIVHRIDDGHVALSRQFFKKTDENTIVNPYAQVLLVEPPTGRMYELDLVYERTETEGPLFERMRTKLDAIAAHEGLTNIFKTEGHRHLPSRSLDAARRLPHRSSARSRRENRTGGGVFAASGRGRRYG